jgi:hypothetical protein
MQIPLGVATVIAVAYLGYVWLARRSATEHYEARTKLAEPTEDQKAKFSDTYGGSAVKILQFYARDGAVTEDQGTVMCYGVLNAKSVRVEPPVADFYPALNRCIDISPKHDTKYVMTAVGGDGKTATAEFTVAVRGDAARGDTARLPRITDFHVSKHTVEDGRHYVTLSFAFENASKVMMEPPVVPALEDSAPFGQWTVTPEKTTTYTLIVMDKKGHKASKQLTVEVPGK